MQGLALPVRLLEDARYRRWARPRPRLGRPAALLLCLLTTVFLSVACGEKEAPPSQPSISLDTKVTTSYYAVHGTSSNDIFASIQAQGLRDGDSGARASGLTSYQPTFNWTRREMKKSCAIDTMTISVLLDMTVPRHSQPDALDAATRKRWDEFAASVASHEQIHVDIYLRGAQRIKEQMAALGDRPSCGELDQDIKQTWDDFGVVVDREQQEFHAREDARIEAALAPLRVRIQQNESQLAQMSGRIDALNATAAALQSQLRAAEAQMATLMSQMDQIESMYRGTPPPFAVERYAALRQQYNETVPRQNTLARQYNSAIVDYNNQVDAYNRLIAETSGLIESYNWTQ